MLRLTRAIGLILLTAATGVLPARAATYPSQPHGHFGPVLELDADFGEPGKHTITSKAEKDATLDFTAEAGKNYYVRQEVKMGVWPARTGLVLEDEATGENGVKGCKMIQ